MSTSDQNFYTSLLKSRNTPAIEKQEFELPSLSGLAQYVSETEVRYQDPLSVKMESDSTKMRHRFKISASSVDRSGDIVVPVGCLKSLQRYKNNPVVFFNHQTYGGLPIAKSEDPDTKQFSFEINANGIIADAYFHCKTQESQDVYELVDLGYLRGASIGFRPIKGVLIPFSEEEEGASRNTKDQVDFGSKWPGIRFEEWELLEWSVVNIPCNPEALEGMKSWISKKNFRDETFRKTLQDLIPKTSKVFVALSDPIISTGDVVNTFVERSRYSTSKNGEFPATALEFDPNFADVEVFEAKVAIIDAVIETKVEEILSIEIKNLEKDLKIKELETLVKSLEAVVAKSVQTKEHDLISPMIEVEVEVEVGIPEEPKKIPPVGAGLLLKVRKGLDENCCLIACKLSQVDNIKTTKFLEELDLSIAQLSKSINKFGVKNYPDWFNSNDIEGEETKTVSFWTAAKVKEVNDAIIELREKSKKAQASLYLLTGKK